MDKQVKENGKTYDVIIVGGGFAGLIAARELEMLGHRVLLVEARDRLGGRTWTDHRLGRDLEIGGTYVHWYQPHLWTELTRYGLEVYRVAQTKKAYWITDGELRSGSAEELTALMKEDVEKIMAKANKYLPRPFAPLESSSFKEMDGVSVTDFFAKFNLTNEQRDLLSSWTGINFNGPQEEGAITQLFRWWAFSNGKRDVFTDTVGRYKIKGGTKSLIEAIAADVKAEIKFSTVVTSIEQTPEGVAVHTNNGESFQAGAAIVTVPLSTLDKIDFKPSLSEKKQAFISERQVSKGVKVWIRLKGEYEPIVTYAPGDYPLQSIIVDDYIDGDTLFVGFGADVKLLDINDKEAVEKVVRAWLPEAEVVECTGHSWAEDEFALESWPMLKPNQLTSYMEEMRRPENGVFLAGTTYANGWAGFIDGAIENAITTSKKVHQYI